jgi:hypothetical protein
MRHSAALRTHSLGERAYLAVGAFISLVSTRVAPHGYDSFTDLQWPRRVADGEDQVRLIIGHGDTHNTLGISALFRDTRDSGVVDPTAPVDPDACQGDRVTWRH